MLSVRRLLAFMLLVSAAAFGAVQQPGTIKVTVVDKHSHEPLGGATVRVAGLPLGASTDTSGRFTIAGVPVGLHSIEIRLLGYRAVTRTDIDVTPGRVVTVEMELQESTLETEGVTVSSGYFQALETAPAGTVAFNAQEIRRSPGSANDVSRILMVLPSVSAVADNANDLAVRGGAPMENAFLVDGIPVPNINQFPVQGSTGGPIGILNVDFIDNVDFLTSGFPAAYGDRTSSVVDIRLRNGNADQTVGKAFLNFAGFGGEAEGPLSSGSWMVSASKSYLDLLVGAIGTGVAPQYGDVQGKAEFELSPSQRLTILDVFGQSRIDFTKSVARDDGQRYYGLNKNLQNTLGAAWRAIWSPSFTSLTTLSFSGTRYQGNFFKISNDAMALASDNTEQSFAIRSIHTLVFDRENRIEFGVEARKEAGRFSYTSVGDTNRLGALDPTYVVSRDIASPKAALFATFTVSPLDGFIVSLGARGSWYDRNATMLAEPRVGLSYAATEVLTLKANAGIVHQDVPLIVLSSGSFNALGQIEAIHAGLGIEYRLSADTRMTVEGYDKEYQNMPLDPADPTLSVVDQSVFNQRFTPHQSLVSTGKAWTRGIEFMLQKKMAKDLYGLVSASVFRSRYEDATGTWRDRIYDNQYIFSVVGGYKPEGTWEYGVRWSYAGGAPYTPFDPVASRAANTGIIDQSRILADRYPAYHSLNLRVDKKFYFERHVLDVYLSVWNAYNQKNVAAYFWNETKNRVDTQYQWSMLPIVGVEYEF
jgi:outer membrane receptor for ferrienterochelin and colicin